jgi:hypothetical protein
MAIILAAQTSVFASLTVGPNLITNGTFASPVIAASSVSAVSPTSWTSTLVNFNEGGEFLVNASAGPFTGVTGGGQDSFPAPEQGQQYVAIGDQSGSKVSQTFTVSSPSTYLLSWYGSSYTSSPYASVSPYEAVITNSSSATIGSLSSTPTADIWTPETMSVNLSDGTYTLSFIPTGYFGQACSLVDAVSLAAVPEPCTLSLLALGGLSMLRRRRRVTR